MKTLTEREVQRNLQAVEHAIAQQQLEGLILPEDTINDLRRAAQGEIDTEEIRRNILRRIKNASISR